MFCSLLMLQCWDSNPVSLGYTYPIFSHPKICPNFFVAKKLSVLALLSLTNLWPSWGKEPHGGKCKTTTSAAVSVQVSSISLCNPFSRPFMAYSLRTFLCAKERGNTFNDCIDNNQDGRPPQPHQPRQK